MHSTPLTLLSVLEIHLFPSLSPFRAPTLAEREMVLGEVDLTSFTYKYTRFKRSVSLTSEFLALWSYDHLYGLP